MSQKPTKPRRESFIRNPTETCSCFNFSDKVKAYKNLLGVCVSFVCSFGSYIGPLYLQSSLNATSGLGLISSALVYGTQIFFLFFCPLLHCLLGSKYSLLLGYLLLVPYVLANYYPQSYTLYPASAVAGMALALIFVNSQIQNSAIADRYAESLKEKSADAIVLFAGVFGVAIKLSQVFGNLISSVTLINLSEGNSSSVTLNDTCTNDEAAYVEQDDLYYVLVSIYFFIAIAGLMIGFFTIDHLGTEAMFFSASEIVNRYFIKSLVKTLMVFCSWKMLLLFPLFLLNGLTLGFMIGTFSKFYVSDCVGVSWIGFVNITNSIISAIAGLVMGRLYRYIPSVLTVYIAVILETGLCLFLIFFERMANYYAIFGFAIGWGVCDGAWMGFLSGIVGAIFTNEKEAAFTVFNIGVSLGFTASFVTALFLSPAIQLWIIVGVLLIAAVNYTILAIAMKLKKPPSSSATPSADDSIDNDRNKMEAMNPVGEESVL